MPAKLMTRISLIALMVFQILTHLFWLPIAAHSGQITIPWMMNQGKVLFGDLLEQHAPGSSLVAAFAQRILPFEPVDTGRLLNLVLVLATTMLVYLLARRLAGDDERAGLLAVLVWVWWEPVYGNILFYFDTLLGFCVLVALVLWMRRDDAGIGTAMLAGFMMGAATLFKQHAWGAVVLFLLWLIIYERRHLVHFLSGLVIIPVGWLIVLTIQGNLDTYLYWNWEFNFSGLMDGVPLDGGLFRKLLLTNVLVIPFVLMAIRGRAGCKGWDCVVSRKVLVFLMWGATTVVLYPRFGEIHAMGHLPLMSVMSGVVLGAVIKEVSGWRVWLRDARMADLALGGVLMALLIGWLWTGIVTYLPMDVFARIGTGNPLAYTEYTELVAAVDTLSEPDDTLFVLPETDSTPQLHVMTGLLPPGTWIKGWYWYFEAPGVMNRLLLEWNASPPSFVIIFPEMTASGEPGINELLLFVEDQYREVGRIEDVFLHGPAVIYEHTDRLPAVADNTRHQSNE